MDKNERQEGQGQEKQQKSAIDRLNQGIDTARNAKSTLETAKKGVKTAKGAAKTLRTASTVIRGGQTVVAAGSALIASAPVWGPIALIVGFFVLVIIVVIVIFTGVSAPPTCKSLTASPTTINNSVPAVLTLENCSENVTYSWDLPQIGGTFSAPQGTTTSYTPPKVNSDQKIYIFVNVCSSSNQDNCSQYSTPEITITNSSPDPGPGPVPVPSCNQVWDMLKSVFGVSVYLGNTIFKDSSCYHLQAIYRTYAISSKSSNYYNLLKKAGPFKIRVYNGARTNSCGGDVLTPNNIKLYVVNDSSGFSCFYRNGPTPLLLHETGHQIRQQTQPLIMSTSWLRNLARGDKTCYDRGFIKSYSLRTTIPASESMAEATMLYVMNSKTSFAPGSAGKPIYNFKRECSSTYNYIKRAVYGNDYEFN